MNEKNCSIVWKWKSREYDTYKERSGRSGEGERRNEDEEADDENRMIERKNDVIFYEIVLATEKAYKLLAVQPGVARVFALRAELCRFAPLARFAITQPRD